MELPDTIRVTLEVARVLEGLRIHYLVGGSVASSIYGHPRSTLDSDLVADLQPRHVQPLTAALSERFYIEPERVEDAIRRRASFNLIHRPTNLAGIKGQQGLQRHQRHRNNAERDFFLSLLSLRSLLSLLPAFCRAGS